MSRAIEWMRKGNNFCSIGNYRKAINAFDQVLSIYPNLSPAWYGKGNALINLGKHQEALDAYTKALSDDPNYVDAYYGKGNALVNLGRYKEAIECYEHALKINPNNKEIVNALEHARSILVTNESLPLTTTPEVMPPKVPNQEILFSLWIQAKNPCSSVKIEKIGSFALKNRKFLNSRSNKGVTTSGIDYAVLKFILEYTTPINWPHELWSQFNQAKDPRSGNYAIWRRYPTLLMNIQPLKPIKELQIHDRRNAQSDQISTSSNQMYPTIPKSVTPNNHIPPELSNLYDDFTLLGEGGVARVYKAKRKRDGEPVAVKIPISLDASTGRAFIAEIKNWTRLDHPNIVKVYDFNIMPLSYFEMELCDSSLAEIQKPIEIEEGLRIIFEICEGLKYAHSRSLVHRDLKPQNILMKNHTPKISDWGLSRIITESTSTTTIAFTPFYAAPEQLNNKAKDERTDIWQLGVILYELVTGKLPFTGENMIEIGMNIAVQEPKRPGDIIPAAKAIEPIIMKCLEKVPAKRYPSVISLQKDIAQYLMGNYTKSLTMSMTLHDSKRSAIYCGELLLLNMKMGDVSNSYKYASDFVHYTNGEVKVEAMDLSKQLLHRLEMGIREIPDELIKKAEFVFHKLLVGL